MKLPRIIIAIDGYASTGKSTFARLIASKLGFLYLDSGAIYRAVTLFSMENLLISPEGVISEDILRRTLPFLKISFAICPDTGTSEVHIGGRCVGGKIRALDVSNNVSRISALPFVRTYVDDILHAYGVDGGIVMDGRDIGTVVFPKAQLKIFMTATPEIRASRRLAELQAKGEAATFEEVLANVKERDYIDSHREVAPLRKAEDALVLDNSDMTIDRQMEWLDGILEERWG